MGFPKETDSDWLQTYSPALPFTVHQQLISAAVVIPGRGSFIYALGQLLRVARVSLGGWEEDKLYLQLLQI